MRTGYIGRMTAAIWGAETLPSPALDMISSIQQIDFTLPGDDFDGTGTIPIEVDTTRSVIFCGYGMFGSTTTTNSSPDPDDNMARYQFNSGTEVEAQRDAGNGGPQLKIHLTIVEFNADVIGKIQTGSITVTGGSATATISEVDLSRSVIVYNGNECSSTTDETFGRGWGKFRFNSSTEIRLNRGVTTDQTIGNFTVIEFAVGIIDTVEELDITISDSGALTATQTLTTPVDVSRTMIVPGGYQLSTGLANEPDEQLTRVDLTDTDTVTITRALIGTDDPQLGGYALQFKEGTIKNIQRGTAKITSGNSSINVTVTEVVIGKSLLNCMLMSNVDSSTIDPERTSTIAKITTTTNINLGVGTAVSSANEPTVGWELIEWN